LKTSAGRLNSVITDLNDVLQLKVGGVEKKEVVLLSKVTEAILNTIQKQIDDQQAVVEIDFSAINELVTVRSYLHSIIYNLIINAIKYRQATVAPKIIIRSRKLTDGLELVIADNGIGIDLKRRKNEVFGLYKRFHSHVEGKGIGLFMVKTQVEILGGNVSVESTVGQGTQFILFFPS
jgi:signal transduction histidine kinase